MGGEERLCLDCDSPYHRRCPVEPPPEPATVPCPRCGGDESWTPDCDFCRGAGRVGNAARWITAPFA
jgi:hypothetical protein